MAYQLAEAYVSLADLSTRTDDGAVADVLAKTGEWLNIDPELVFLQNAITMII